jgi:polar amino acid transport system substrate-binding protein
MKKIVVFLLTCVLMLGTFGCGSAQQGTNSDGNSGQQTAKTDWDYIKDKGEMIIGITYYAPMNYKDSAGKLIGFETEFAEAVCTKLGVKAVFQEIDWNAKETELNAKNIDAIWNGMTKNEERMKNMDFSLSYLNNRPVMIVRTADEEKYQTPESLAGASVIAEAGSMAEDIAKSDAFFAQGKFTGVDTQIKAFLELKSKTADVCVGDYVMAIGSLGAGTDFADLQVSKYKTFDPEEYGIGFRKGSVETLKQVNGAIEELKASGELNTIADHYKLTDLLIK